MIHDKCSGSQPFTGIGQNAQRSWHPLLIEFETLVALQTVMKKNNNKRNIAIKTSDQNEEIVCRNGMQIITFSRLLQTGIMSCSL